MLLFKFSNSSSSLRQVLIWIDHYVIMMKRTNMFSNIYRQPKLKKNQSVCSESVHYRGVIVLVNYQTPGTYGTA